MLRGFESAIDGLVRRVEYDAVSLCNRIGSVADEDDFTSRLAQDIERSINGELIGGLQFTAITKKLKWRGARAEERVLGADLMLVLRLQAHEIDVSKGYLIQAKMNAGSLHEISVKDAPGLSRQIKDMLKATSDAYVWAYSDEGIAVASPDRFRPRSRKDEKRNLSRRPSQDSSGRLSAPTSEIIALGRKHPRT